jgi:hypothetical protein
MVHRILPFSLRRQGYYSVRRLLYYIGLIKRRRPSQRLLAPAGTELHRGSLGSSGISSSSFGINSSDRVASVAAGAVLGATAATSGFLPASPNGGQRGIGYPGWASLPPAGSAAVSGAMVPVLGKEEMEALYRTVSSGSPVDSVSAGVQGHSSAGFEWEPEEGLWPSPPR